jgi:ATP-binding cassette subfamily F protein uup
VKPRKLTFKEARELEQIETHISGAEENIQRLQNLFLEPDFHRKHGHRTAELNEELAEAKNELAKLLARWEELEALRAGEAEAQQTLGASQS